MLTTSVRIDASDQPVGWIQECESSLILDVLWRGKNGSASLHFESYEKWLDALKFFDVATVQDRRIKQEVTLSEFLAAES